MKQRVNCIADLRIRILDNIAAITCIALALVWLNIEFRNSAAAKAANDPGIVNFVIETPKKVEFSTFTLSNPHRLVVDLPDTPLRLPDMEKLKKKGIIKGFQYGLILKDRARLIIETKRPAFILETSTKPAAQKGWTQIDLKFGQRLITSSVSKQGLMSLGGSMVRPPRPSQIQKPAQENLPLIVIDPGHGGTDTGAIKHGIREKEVVLAFSRNLRERLKKTGRYRVLMTRTRDIFVDLKERAAFARRHNARLFISVHADYVSSRQSHVRGATFYSLRSRTARRLAQSDERHLKVTDLVPNSKNMPSPVKKILVDWGKRGIHQNEGRTNLFVNSLKEYMGDATKLKPNPHRTANFAVLKSAQVPSVLIELAYVSNAQDAKLLKSLSWRENVSQALTAAIDNYFSHAEVRVP